MEKKARVAVVLIIYTHAPIGTEISLDLWTLKKMSNVHEVKAAAVGVELPKKRRWGKARTRDSVTVIGNNELEDSLQKLEEERKERKSLVIATSQEHNDSGSIKSTSFGVLDLQQPQLMSNERLIEALKKINVPIPVYPDGSPSRERLLYLYRTFVLPQPQRNKQQWGRRRFRGKRKNNGEMINSGKGDWWENGDNVEGMAVDMAEDDGISGNVGMKR